MRNLISRVYNYYAPVVLILWLAFARHWVWLLGAIGVLLVTISYNLETLTKAVAQAEGEIIRRLGTPSAGPDKDG